MTATPATIAALSAENLTAAGLSVLGVSALSPDQSVIELEDQRGGVVTISVTAGGEGWNFLIADRTVGDTGSWFLDGDLRPEIIKVDLGDLSDTATPRAHS